VVPEGTTPVELASRLYADRIWPPVVDCVLTGVRGARLKALGPRNGQWHDVEVSVTSEGVTATLNGDRMSLPAGLTRKAVEFGASSLRERHPRDPFVQALRPEYSPRGGLGLILFRGAASVRRVSVSPLPADR
jgi:serine/threonine-protein kinase